jgi:hypothetical protein
MASSSNREGERKMSEVEGLKAEIAALRGEVEQWKSRVVEIMGVASRAQGFTEGVAGTQKIINESYERRLAALESKPSLKPLPFGQTYISPSPNSGEAL